MTETARPLRADAARNRAGVGAGTVYRHFPTKEDLYKAVIEDRLNRIVDDGRALLASVDPGDALFAFLRSMVLQWGATDRGLAEALAGLGVDVKEAVPDGEDAFLGLLGDLLRAAQEAGTVRRDLDVRDVKALMVGAQAIQTYNAEAAERLTEVVLDGLRPK
jgi:AcrR family transcriptional regulator